MEIKEHQGKSLEYLIVEPDGYDASRRYPLVVLLHGYGANMGDLAGLSPAIDKGGYVYAFPNGPVKVRLGYGLEGRAWTPSVDGAGDETLERSAERLAAFFDEVMDTSEIEPGRAVLGGFSQGGMMAYRCGLPAPDIFCGLAALSSRIPDPEAIRQDLPATREQPIFISHGTADTMISVQDGRESRRFLEDHGYSPEYREYEMGHEISQEVLLDLVSWIHKVLAPVRLEETGP